MNDKQKLPPLESGLLSALQALDNQVQREMQRSPAEREVQGVQKWEPFQKRIERVSVFLLDSLGEQAVDLDSLIILSQAVTKAMKLAIEDLGQDGLGEMRSSYLAWAMENIARDASDSLTMLGKNTELT